MRNFLFTFMIVAALVLGTGGTAHKRELKALAVRFNNNARQLRATYACCGTVWRRTT
jgi:hypothetical protein